MAGSKGVARIWFRGGGHPFRGGPTPYFSPQTPNHKGPPLCTFGYPRISGGARAPPPPPWLRPWQAVIFGMEGASLDHAPEFEFVDVDGLLVVEIEYDLLEGGRCSVALEVGVDGSEDGLSGSVFGEGGGAGADVGHADGVELALVGECEAVVNGLGEVGDGVGDVGAPASWVRCRT